MAVYTAKQIAERFGVSQSEASGFIKVLLAQNIAKTNGFAPKTEKQKGKAAVLYEIPDIITIYEIPDTTTTS